MSKVVVDLVDSEEDDASVAQKNSKKCNQRAILIVDDDDIRKRRRMGFEEKPGKSKRGEFSGCINVDGAAQKTCLKAPTLEKSHSPCPGFELEELDESSHDFCEVAGHFKRSCVQVRIVKIERIKDDRRRKKFESHRNFMNDSQVSIVYLRPLVPPPPRLHVEGFS
jgi:hypothetical protein